MTPPLRIRRAVRALLLDSDDRVLLVRFEFPTATVWATPGGGQEPGEDDEVTLRRELREEVGLADVDIGPLVWMRRHVVPFLDGSWDGQRDHIYLVRTAPFEPTPMLSWEELRAERLHELRWWTVDELAAMPPTARFAPRKLPALLADLIRDGAPETPIETGI
ncbi:MAG: NUDIX domain-containing protein [Actinomycetota bacterium]|nr:NUDIX domain-containing protein [Actinomycetota bacterium]